MIPILRASFLQPGELVIDNFAGGGGASTGIERALGQPVDIAINHDPEAIAMHRENHPETKHFCEDIWTVDPSVACGSRPVGLAWFSPDCRHFSRAKGTAPVEKNIRGLAWVVTRWAEAVRPRVIILENVEEFQTWGPLDESGRPDKGRTGDTFREWLSKLTGLGYSVEFRSLVAADYGTPTTRKRLYLIARRDGNGAGWPMASHSKPSWVQAHNIIDWSLPVRSLFKRKKPLAEATMWRLANGVDRYVVGAKQPFIVRHGHFSNITGAGKTFRGQPLDRPLSTVCGTNDRHLVVPFVTKHYGGVVGHEITRPLGTVTARDHHALTAAFLTKFYGTSTGAPLDMPLPTVTGGGWHIGEVRAFLAKYCGEEQPSLFGDRQLGLVSLDGEDYQIFDIGMRMLAPHELFAAQGFPADYKIRPTINGKPASQETQLRLCGNSVCPPVAEALVTENICRRAEAA